MTDLRAQLIEDRHLRDSARALIDASVENVRTEFSSVGLAERAKDRLTDGAAEVYDEAVHVAADNKGALAAIVAALMMWFARNPLGDLLGDAFAKQDDENAHSTENARAAATSDDDDNEDEPDDE